jgi:hypothetical protein
MGTSTKRVAPARRHRTTAATCSWPSANTDAATVSSSPAMRLTAKRPPSTFGVTSSMQTRERPEATRSASSWSPGFAVGTGATYQGTPSSSTPANSPAHAPGESAPRFTSRKAGSLDNVAGQHILFQLTVVVAHQARTGREDISPDARDGGPFGRAS